MGVLSRASRRMGDELGICLRAKSTIVTMSRNLRSQRDAEHGSTNRELKFARGWARMCAKQFASVFTPVIRVSGDK